MPNELRECPFCGQIPEIFGREYSDGRSAFHVACNNLECDVDCRTMAFDTEEDAIEKWNRRADNG